MNETSPQQTTGPAGTGPSDAEQTRRALTNAQRQVNILRDQKRALDKQLAARLQPLLETKAMASAEPPAEKAALIDSAIESAPGSADH